MALASPILGTFISGSGRLVWTPRFPSSGPAVIDPLAPTAEPEESEPDMVAVPEELRGR
jgi:hypothetical protein